MAKSLKLPPLNRQTKILSFDIESNGLHGPAFAVGAVVMDAQGTTIDQFTARTAIRGKVDPWVKQHVLPVIEDLAINCQSYKQLREVFWQWFIAAEPKVDYVLVNNGYPVEYRFLLACQKDNLSERYWQHPFPILELSSLLIQAGSRSAIPSKDHRPHHPLDDATAAVKAAFRAFKLAN